MVIPAFKPTKAELVKLGDILDDEIDASRQVERIIYKQTPVTYRTLHRKLCIE
jgi:hypothetical protein